MEKLIALSDLFEISLDELMLGKKPDAAGNAAASQEIMELFKEKVLTVENKKKARTGLKITAIILAVIFAIDLISMLVCFLMYAR